MTEQTTIFDDSFGTGLKIRRFALMPLFLKIYLVLFSIYGIYQVFGQSYYMYKMIHFYVEQDLFGVSDVRITIMLARSFLGAAVLVTMLLSLWMEWKWAIRFNWGVLVYWTLMSVVDYVYGNGYGYYLGIIALVLAPYYSMLYHIQKRWERDAFSGRELRQGENN
ncbi:hypothetical protein [Chitinophaga sancti]|uniref:hypothetical protein n=1 Tax=Chitinophaga sancti TaxID=1004 RepID=UPI003F79BF1C